MEIAKQKTLLELMNEAVDISHAIADAGGELTPELEQRLEVNDKMLPHKIDQYYAVLKRLESGAEFYQKEADELYDTAKALTMAHKRLKDRIKFVLESSEKTALNGNLYGFKLSQRKPKLVIDEQALDPGFKIANIKYVPDRERIEQVIDAGGQVEGVSLESVTALLIGTVKR